MKKPLLSSPFAWALFFMVLPALARASEQPSAPSRLPPPPKVVPGIVVHHIPQSSGVFIGSPSLAVLPNGDYVASHDEFGPQSSEFTKAVSHVFRSADRGQSWCRIATIHGQFWSTLFVHRGALYLVGTDRHHGNVIIRQSMDGGVTWTSPTNSVTGLLRDNGEYHCAPVPVIEHQGRLWRAIERRQPPRGWGITYGACMMSVPSTADLLKADNWTFSNFLPGNTNWLEGAFNGWLEGNAVVTRNGNVLDILRVDTASYPEKAARVNVTPDGKLATFEPARGFIHFPGGAKKFTIRFDAKSGQYWSLTTSGLDQPRTTSRPAALRNSLVLTCSSDLTHWTIRRMLLSHPDSVRHGFQYVDWLFDGDDIIAVCRTAYEDDQGGAHNYHDANFLTFHRWRNFRNLTLGEEAQPPQNGSNLK